MTMNMKESGPNRRPLDDPNESHRVRKALAEAARDVREARRDPVSAESQRKREKQGAAQVARLIKGRTIHR